MSDFIEEIRCALAMRDAGYDALLGHEATAELLRRHDALVKSLDEILACGSDHELHEALIRARRVRDVVGEVNK